MPRGVYDRSKLRAAEPGKPLLGEVEPLMQLGPCSACFFFRLPSPPVGNCHRHPVTIRKSANDFCGEFKPKPVA